MKKISILFLSLLVLIGCSKFWEDGLIGPIPVFTQDNAVVALVLSKATATTANFKSDIFLKEDSSGTEYREVQFSDTLVIATLVRC